MKQFFYILFFLFLCGHTKGEEYREPDVTLNEDGKPFAKLQALREAKLHDFSFLETESQLQWFIKEGLLVELRSEANYWVKPMTKGRPYVRPEVREFIRTLSHNLFAHCGEPLVVTSALRFRGVRLKNSPPETVHPTGMAVDLRAPSDECLEDFETELLFLEAEGLIQANKERWPEHYHATVYPRHYAEKLALHARVKKAKYQVRRGDTLSTIAKRFGTSIEALVANNELKSPDRLSIGQLILLH